VSTQTPDPVLSPETLSMIERRPITWQEILMAPIPAPDVAYPYTPKCGRCGRFTKNLTLVWTGGPEPEPDYEVGSCCK